MLFRRGFLLSVDLHGNTFLVFSPATFLIVIFSASRVALEVAVRQRDAGIRRGTGRGWSMRQGYRYNGRGRLGR